MAHKRKQVENLEQKVMEHKKKYVRIAEGAQLYSILSYLSLMMQRRVRTSGLIGWMGRGIPSICRAY